MHKVRNSNKHLEINRLKEHRLSFQQLAGDFFIFSSSLIFFPSCVSECMAQNKIIATFTSGHILSVQKRLRTRPVSAIPYLCRTGRALTAQLMFGILSVGGGSSGNQRQGGAA